MKFNFYQRFLLVQLALLRLRQFGANVFRSYIDRTSLLCQFSGCECLSEPKFEWCKMEQWSLSWLISGGSNISLSRPAQEEREINVIVFTNNFSYDDIDSSNSRSDNNSWSLWENLIKIFKGNTLGIFIGHRSMNGF